MGKKTLIFLILPLLVLCSCGDKTSPVELSAEEIIDAVYKAVETKDFMRDLRSGLMTEAVTENNEQYYLGINGIPYEDGAASEAVVQPVTYSFCVIKLKSGVKYDAERIKIENSVNKAKWVCARAEEAYVIRYENVIAVIMGTKECCDGIEEAFLSVLSGK